MISGVNLAESVTESASDRFPTTDWQLIIRVGEQGTGSLDLHRLLEIYQPIVRRYLKFEKRLGDDRIDDVLHDFIADKILAQQLVARADKSMGRFRSFLIRSLENYILDAAKYETRAKRRPATGEPVSLDPTDVKASTNSDPATMFDRMWAESVLQAALQQTQAHCVRKGREAQWRAFEYRIVHGHRPDASCYQEIIAQFGFKGLVEAGNAITTCKRLFRRRLQQVLSDFSPVDEPEFKEQIAELFTIFAETRAGFRPLDRK